MAVSGERYAEIADRYAWGDILPPEKVPKILYHYTDASGLIGILSSGVVRATHYSFLNDMSEVRHTDRVFKGLVTEKLKEGPSPTVNLLYSTLIERGSFLTANEEVYIFSMTEDSDSLSQWRAYARDGKGFSIGFDARRLAKLAASSDAQFGLRKVVYDEDSQKETLLKALNEIEAFYKNDIKGKKQKNTIIDEISSAISELIIYRGTTNKHGAFSVEREWRLVGFPDHEIDVKVRARSDELVPYIEFSFASPGRLPIVSLGVGPGFTAGEQRQAVDLLCRQHGYVPKIYLADAPFRSVR